MTLFTEHITKLNWPYERVGDIWLFRKFDTSVLVCEGTPVYHEDKGGYVTFKNGGMLEVSIYTEYNEETDTVQIKQQYGEKHPWHYQSRAYMQDSMARWVSDPVKNKYISREGLELAKQILEKYVYEQIPAWILKGKSTVYGQEMIRESNFYQYPQNYRSDLYYHDFEYIGRYSPIMFGWILYRSGTNIITNPESARLYVKHRMAQFDQPKYYRAWQGILAQQDPKDLLNWAVTHLKEDK